MCIGHPSVRRFERSVSAVHVQMVGLDWVGDGGTANEVDGDVLGMGMCWPPPEACGVCNRKNRGKEGTTDKLRHL